MTLSKIRLPFAALHSHDDLIYIFCIFFTRVGHLFLSEYAYACTMGFAIAMMTDGS